MNVSSIKVCVGIKECADGMWGRGCRDKGL